MFLSEISYGSILTSLVVLISIYIIRLYIRCLELPSGPFPIPFLGNILKFYTSKHVNDIFKELGKKYGGIYTVWMGPIPFVMISDWKMIKEARYTKRNDFLSRFKLRSVQPFLDYVDTVTFEGYTKKWEVSRKIAHAAVRKFTDHEKLALVINEQVTTSIGNMLSKDGSFNPIEYLEALVYNIIAEIAFGESSLSENDFQKLNDLSVTMHKYIGNTPGDASYILTPFFYHRELAIKRACVGFGQVLTRKLQENKETYSQDQTRHFIDCVLNSATEAKENPEEKEFLKDENLKKIVGILWLAGTDTNMISLSWIFLILALNPDVQKRLKKELKTVLGERMPQQNDRYRCPYTWAVITETLRLRAPTPLGAGTATNADTEIHGVKLKNGTNVILNYGFVNMDPALWPEPDKFKPERFLQTDGSYSPVKMEGFSTFGHGKRNCIGEKLARNMLFLIIANFLRDHEIIIDDPLGIVNLEPKNNPFFNLCNDFNIKFI